MEQLRVCWQLATEKKYQTAETLYGHGKGGRNYMGRFQMMDAAIVWSLWDNCHRKHARNKKTQQEANLKCSCGNFSNKEKWEFLQREEENYILLNYVLLKSKGRLCKEKLINASIFGGCFIYDIYVLWLLYMHRYTYICEQLRDVNIKSGNNTAHIYFLNIAFNIYRLVWYSCEILNKTSVRINEILKQICMVCVL